MRKNHRNQAPCQQVQWPSSHRLPEPAAPWVPPQQGRQGKKQRHRSSTPTATEKDRLGPAACDSGTALTGVRAQSGGAHIQGGRRCGAYRADVPAMWGKDFSRGHCGTWTHGQ